MISPKTVTPDQPQAVPDALTALAALTDAFLSRHGCFPLDRTNADERAWHSAMTDAYRLVGQPGTPDRVAKLAARPVLLVETPAEGLREALLVKGLRDAQAHINEAYDIAREAKDHGACHFHAIASDAISDLLDDPSNSVVALIIHDGGKQDEQVASTALAAVPPETAEMEGE